MRCFQTCLGVLALLLSVSQASGGEYPCRWVYVSRGLHKDQDVEDVRGIVKTAAEHRLNGMVLAAGLDLLDRQPAEYLRRLEAVKQACAERRVEIIPIIFSAGYGGSVLAYDRNLAEGLLVKDARFVVRGREARLETDLPVEISNGGFEDHAGDRVRGCRFHDLPGKVSFVDTQVAKEGQASLRFENFGQFPHGHARVLFEVPVRPHRCYRLAGWLKTDNLQPAGCFHIQVLTENRSLAPITIHVASTSDWRPVIIGFNSMGYDKVRIYAGVWGGKQGRFWLDDLRIEEVGLVNVLRRPGTPLSVREESSGTVYEEGRDFAPIADAKLTFRFDHPGPAIRLLPGSRIRDGQALRVSYYHGMAIHDGQVTACMSEPKVYDIWRKQAELIQKHLAPKRWLLSMDEIRAGGSCEACKARKMSMAQILGDCFTRQFEIIRAVNPQAEVFVWSDMLDPNHNAHGNYYLVEGDYTGSWKYVPKDLRIVCWYYEKRKESLAHFSGLGFKTLAGAYYDGDTLENPKGWLEALAQTPGAVGIMYTTWQNKYQLLGPFGDLLAEKKSKGRRSAEALEHAKSIGYSEQELAGIPEGVVCRGCGNPTALAELKEGDTVLDVGSGGGLDAFLAVRRVGPTGRVIGIDISAEAIAKATASAAKGSYTNLVFKQADMAKLPLADQSIDVVISNCVLNYPGDKLAAFKEVFRCLKPNSRMLITDLVVEGGFPDEVLRDQMWGAWLRGAAGKQDYLKTIRQAGFTEVAVVRQTIFPMAESDERLRGKIVSIAVKARK